LLDVGRGGKEVVTHHQQAIDGFLHTGSAQGVAGEALGRADLRCLVAEHFTDGLELGHVTHRGGSAVGVEVVDGAVNGGQGLLHAAYWAYAARVYHVVAVVGGAEADRVSVDLGAAGQGVFEVLDHDHAGAAGDDEA